MKNGKKWVFRALIVVVVLVMAVLGGAQYLLQNRLKTVLDAGLPRLEAEKGLKVSISGASVNAFGGSAQFSGVDVQNLGAGYGEAPAAALGELSVNVGLMNLMNGTLDAQKVELQGFEVNLVRNAENRLNVNDLTQALIGRDVIPMPTLRGALAADAGASTPEVKVAVEKVADSDKAEQEPMPIRVGELKVDGRFDYVDYRVAQELATLTDKPVGEPFRLALEMSTQAENIHYLQDGEWGRVHITGHLVGKEELVKIDLRGDLGPVVDPDRIDLKLQGTIENVDLKMFDIFALGKEPALSSEHPVEIDVNLECSAGVVNSNVSQVVIRFKEVLLSRELEKKYHVARLPYVTIPMRLSGPLSSMKLEKPKTGDVLMSSILESAGDEAVQQELKDKASEALMKSDDLDKYLDEDDKKKLNEAIKGVDLKGLFGR